MPGDDDQPRGPGHAAGAGGVGTIQARGPIDRKISILSAESATEGSDGGTTPGSAADWLSALGDPAVGLTRTGKVAVVNEAFCARFGLDASEVVGENHHDALGHSVEDGRALSPERCELCRLVAGGEPGHATLRLRMNSESVTVSVAVGPALEGHGELARVVSFCDLTWWERREQVLSERARTDYLTRLSNRYELHDVLGQLAESGETAAVLMVDLDDFKDVNDRFGHLLADELLAVVGQRLRGLMRDRDLVARMGGDEFAVVLRGVTLEQAQEVAERVRVAIERPFDLHGHELRVGASVGVSEPGPVGDQGDRLLAAADESLREAKAGGKGCVVVAGELVREPDDVLPDVNVADARSWANYVRDVRSTIAEAKEAGLLPAEMAAPEPVHRTLLMLLEAVDSLPDRETADLPLPHPRRLIAFAIYHVAALRWIDRLWAHGAVRVPRPFAGERFWQHLETHLDKRSWGVQQPRGKASGRES